MDEIRQASHSNHITFLNHLVLADSPSVGEKALALGILSRAGLLVPAGFVVTAGSDDEIEAAYHDLERQTARPAVPVAVRASLLGDERQVGPPRPAETDLRGVPAVIDAVRQCHARQAAPAAVIVQRMAVGERAGIVYSVDPVRRDDGVVRVTAGFGADTTWSCAHQVDTYLVSRRTCELMQAVIVPKAGRVSHYRRVLSDDEAVRVATTAIRIEQCLGGPQAIDYLVDRTGQTVVLKASRLEPNRGKTAAA